MVAVLSFLWQLWMAVVDVAIVNDMMALVGVDGLVGFDC